MESADCAGHKKNSRRIADKWSAIVWMCRNQLGRRNITREQRDYLLSQEYEAQCKTVGGNGSNQHGKKEQLDENHQIAKGDTRAAIAKSHRISQYEVQKAVEFGRGLDAAEEVSPGIKGAVLSGTVKAPKQMIAEIRNLPDEEKKAAVQAIKEGKKPEKKITGRLTSSDIDLIAKITAGLKNMDKPPAAKEEVAEDFGRILMNGVNEADDWLESRYKDMGPGELKKIIAALEQAEAEVKKIRMMVDRH